MPRRSPLPTLVFQHAETRNPLIIYIAIIFSLVLIAPQLRAQHQTWIAHGVRSRVYFTRRQDLRMSSMKDEINSCRHLSDSLGCVFFSAFNLPEIYLGMWSKALVSESTGTISYMASPLPTKFKVHSYYEPLSPPTLSPLFCLSFPLFFFWGFWE